MSAFFSEAPPPTTRTLIPLDLTEGNKENIPPPYEVQRRRGRKRRRRSARGNSNSALAASPTNRELERNAQNDTVMTEPIEAPLAEVSRAGGETPPQSPSKLWVIHFLFPLPHPPYLRFLNWKWKLTLLKSASTQDWYDLFQIMFFVLVSSSMLFSL